MKMIRPQTLLAVFFFLNLNANAQTKSLDSFRHQYKEDLYEIIKEDTAFIKFYPENKTFITEASVTLLSGEQPFKLFTSSGKTKEAQKYAKLSFEINGNQYALYAYQLLALKDKEASANHLFIPFTDNTNIMGSYGGGRYIDAESSDIINGIITLDFNKAYNPYCAFTTGYNCPIPPRENSLDLEIEAGEMYDVKHFGHEND